jgi:hypothetical protein
MTDGVGNGFPFCPPKVDVSGFDHWTTLSGWSKVDTPASDSAKATSIASSRAFAAKLFWNIDGYATGECTVTTAQGPTASIPFPVGSADATSGSLDEPKDRACYTGDEDGYIVHDEVLGTDDFGDPLLYDLDVHCGAPKIVRMYDGMTTNEDNFVGYGIDSLGDRIFYMEVQSFPNPWSIDLISFGDDVYAASAYTEINPSGSGGIHFLCVMDEDPGVPPTYYTFDPVNRSIDADEITGSNGAITSIEMGSFDFYTY